jgi:hypothetical protein
MKNNNKNSILDWEKLRSQPPLVQAISILSLEMLVAMVFTTRQYIVTLPWFTYVALAGGICLFLGIFLYAYKGRFQTVGKYFFSFVVIVYAALIVTVYAGIGTEREWKDLEVESYYVHSTSGIKLKGPSYLVVTIDDQPEHIYKYNQSPETLAKRYGTDFNDSVTVDLTARQIVPHFYVKPKAKVKPKAANAATPTID